MNRTTVFLISFGLALLLLGAHVALRLTRPSDGIMIKQGEDGQQLIYDMDITLVRHPQQTVDIQSGDSIISVGDKNLEEWSRHLVEAPFRGVQLKAGDTVLYEVERKGDRPVIRVKMGHYMYSDYINGLSRVWGQAISVIVFMLVGVYVYIKRPDVPAAQVLYWLGFTVLLSNTMNSLRPQVSDFTDPLVFWFHYVVSSITSIAAFTAIFHFALVFPTQPAGIRPWHIALIYILPCFILLAAMLVLRPAFQSSLAWLETANRVWNLIYGLSIIGAMTVAMNRWLKTPDARVRGQIGGLIFGGACIGFLNVLLVRLPIVLSANRLISLNASSLIDAVFPILLAATVLRFRLFDINFVLSRRPIFVSLVLLIFAFYVLAVILIAVLVGATLGGRVINSFESLAQAAQRDIPFWIPAILGIFIALIIQPIYAKLRRIASQIVYGERDNPYSVVARISKYLDPAAIDSALVNITKSVSQSLKLSYASIRLRRDDKELLVAEHGSLGPNDITHRLPLKYESRLIGEMLIAQSSGDSSLNHQDHHVLAEVAQFASTAAFVTMLTSDLRMSREQVIRAREEERRRIQRDLHDGLGPSLGGIALELEAVCNLMKSDPVAAAALVNQLKAQIKTTVFEVRQLVHDLRPPILQQLGLYEAIRSLTQKITSNHLSISVIATDTLPTLSAAVELSAYRIAQEALTNVVKHADATACQVSLNLSDSCLKMTVSDNGSGMRTNQSDDLGLGFGLASMAERASEVGGTIKIDSTPSGTHLLITLPLTQQAWQPERIYEVP